MVDKGIRSAEKRRQKQKSTISLKIVQMRKNYYAGWLKSVLTTLAGLVGVHNISF